MAMAYLGMGVEVTGAVTERYAEILTPEALAGGDYRAGGAEDGDQCFELGCKGVYGGL